MSWEKITEKQNKSSLEIDKKSIIEILKIINKEDVVVSEAIKKSLHNIEKFIDDLISCFISGGRLFYVGSGTSGRLGVLDAVECPPTFCTDPGMIQGIIAGGYDALIQSIEGAEDSAKDGKKAIIDFKVNSKDAVLGISASSTTPFVIGALEKSKEIGAMTGLIICTLSNKVSFIDHLISIVVGPEVITGSTRMKSGTATKMVLNMISTTSMIKLNKTYGNLMVDLKASNKKLWDRGARILSHVTKLDYLESTELLQKTDGEVKTAIIVAKLNIGIQNARDMIKNNSGSLRKILEK